MFGRATIRLGIGPHSSLLVYLRKIAVFIQSKRLQNQRNYRHHWFHYTELQSSLVMMKTHTCINTLLPVQVCTITTNY